MTASASFSERVPAGGQRQRPVDASLDWRTWYESRLVSAEVAMSQVQRNDYIWIPVGQRATPLINALIARLTKSHRSTSVVCQRTMSVGTRLRSPSSSA